MKKHITTLLVLICCQVMMAQTDGSLIVKEYSLDEWRVIHGRTYVDMNDDGENEFAYEVQISSFGMSAPYVLAIGAGCFYCIDSTQYPVQNFFVDLDTPLNDSTLNYGTGFGVFQLLYNDKCWNAQYHLDTLRYKAAVRKGHAGEYYYGWLEAYSVVTYNYDSVWFYLARTCYCSIPNYPLRWGQTSFDWVDISENETSAFATIHPNPTTGLITINGKDLKAAEVVNTLGQRVATAHGKGDQMTIDIANLPEGVYFVRITNEQGRKCVRKVVKE